MKSLGDKLSVVAFVGIFGFIAYFAWLGAKPCKAQYQQN